MHMAYMIAVIYGNVRLLPQGHPYLMPENIGRYGIRHVIAEAANNLVFSRRNIDQVLMFFTILTGLVLLGLQFILLIVAVIGEHPAYALQYVDLFNNPNGRTGSVGPTQDLAFIIMDRVFGIGDGRNNLFNSCVSDIGQNCMALRGTPLANMVVNTPGAFPFPFHLALHKLLQFYSMGIFWVGASVIIYFIITIVTETAQTGIPFGQRFNKAWAPVRFILFFALILPLNTAGGPNEGLNGAQLITFFIVKMGSNLATNGWTYFNGAGTASVAPAANYMSQQKSIVAQQNIPEVNDLIQAIHVARTCAAAYHLEYGLNGQIEAYLVRPPVPSGVTAIGTDTGSTLTPDVRTLRTTSYADAKNFNYQGNIVVRFGRLGRPDPNDNTKLEDKYEFYKGNVKPLCGDITMQIQGVEQPGADTIFQGYYNMLIAIWDDQDIIDRAECEARNTLTNSHDPSCTPLPDRAFAQNKATTYRTSVRTAVTNGLNAQNAGAAFNLPPEILERGWAGAAIWYNRIAQMNGAVTTATLNIPKLSKLPFLMDIAAKGNQKESDNLNSRDAFQQNMVDQLGVNVLFNISPSEREILTAMVNTHDFWVSKGDGHLSNFDKTTGNVVIDFINAVFGTSGIFTMRENADIHPLAQLTTLGKGMMDATLRNAAYGAILTGVGGIAKKVDLKFEGEMAATASKFFFTMTMATLGMSVVLYYVLPFLPFIYFMFAISGWVKSIFEAIVAMPLWALAHLRIDGEGMPGPGATNGYFLLLEIFLRPILIIFGFLASISIFSALVDVLNQIFDIVVENAGGFDQELETNIESGAVAGFVSKIGVSRGPLDEFFFTAMYVIICYLMGLASFKLIDLIPNNILRWMGVSVSTFQENADDPAGKLSSQVYRGTSLAGNQISGRMQGDLALITAS